MYSIMAALGVVPDLQYNKSGYKPLEDGYRLHMYDTAVTDWQPMQKGSPATTLQLQWKEVPANASFSLVLSIGIRYGMMQDASTVQQVRHVGCAKILAMV